jgi:hypothetical protein
VTLVDGSSFDVRGWKFLQLEPLSQGEALRRHFLNGMIRPSSQRPFFEMVDNDFWADDFASLTDVQKPNIEAATKALLEREIEPSLRLFNLVP